MNETIETPECKSCYHLEDTMNSMALDLAVTESHYDQVLEMLRDWQSWATQNIEALIKAGLFPPMEATYRYIIRYHPEKG